MPRFKTNELKQLKQLKSTKCCNCNIECGDEIIFHHVIPISIGGSTNITNIVPLCTKCHHLLHNISEDGKISHSALTKIGLEKAKQKGSQIGKQKGDTWTTKRGEEYKNIILKESKDFNGTQTDADIIRKYSLTKNTYYKYKKILKNT